MTVKQLMNEREDHMSELTVLRDNKDVSHVTFFFILLDYNFPIVSG